MFRTIVALLLFCSTALAGDPTIVGSPGLRVKVGTPPFVTLTVKDAPEGSVQTWAGDIGGAGVAVETKTGLAVATVAGAHTFRCVLQTPSEGLDPLTILDVTVVVEKADGTIPPPPPPPVVEDFATKLTKAVKAAATPEARDKLEMVADGYEGIANQIKAGSPLLTTPQAVIGITAITTRLSAEWAQIDADVVQPHLKTLTLTTAADYEPVWRQIAAAVKAGLTDIPPPVVVDPPITVTGLHVLVVWDKDQAASLPASQVSIRTSTALVDWFKANNVQWRQFYADQDQSQLEKKWKDGLARPRASTPWLVASNGTRGFEGPLPKTVDELIALLGNYK